MFGSRGRPSRLQGTLSACKLKRICGAKNCGMEITGRDLERHYISRTNFNALTHLKTLDEELAKYFLKIQDSHTVFML